MLAWLNRLIGTRPPSGLEALADFEIESVAQSVWPLFGDNLRNVAECDPAMTSAQYREVTDLFLWGMTAAALAGFPALPTDPKDRIVLHLTRYFDDEQPRQRAIEAKALLERRDPWLAHTAEAGALAFATGDAEALNRVFHRQLVERRT